MSLMLLHGVELSLHEKFAETDPDQSICHDATAMLFAPGLKLSGTGTTEFGADPRKLCVMVKFGVPGSKDTRKTLKSNDRIIRKIHDGETLESYRDIQRILGLKETNLSTGQKI